MTFVEDITLRRADTTLEGRAATTKAIDRPVAWTNRNLMVSNKDKFKVLPLKQTKALQ